MTCTSIAWAQSGSDGRAILEEVWTLVDEKFFDPDCNGVDWPAMKRKYAPLVERVTDPDQLAMIINQLLGELNTSHTHYYPPTTTEYYGLIDIFASGPFGKQTGKLFPDGVARYCGVGIKTTLIEGEHFILDVLEEMPASRAGLLVGDRLISVDDAPFHPINSFKGKAGRNVRLKVQRNIDPVREYEVVITPEMIVPGEMYLASVSRSATMHEHNGKRLAYVRLRSYAGEQYHEALKELVLYGDLREADGLVLDLRGGWGGASPEYLNLFNVRTPVLGHITREGVAREFDSQWRKPVVLLIDEGSRSGKEILAYGFRKYGLGPVVGARTMGAVVGGQPFLLSNKSILYLAVIDATVDGERLEGVGVEPDVMVEFQLPYAAGADPQREKAFEVLLDEIVNRTG